MSYVQGYMQAVSATLASLPWEQIERAVDVLYEARLRRAQVFVCGNGGSAATASHMVNDLNKGANVEGMPRFRAIGLTDNMPLLTALSNDISYADALAEQLRNLARPGDVLVGISGSGNSANVLNAARLARELGLTIIGFIGFQGGKLADLVDVPIIAPNACMEQIEDIHMFLDHALVSALRDRGQREQPPSLILANSYSACPNASTPDRPQRAAVFLDRDGVINANRDDHVKCWDEVALLPGVIEALRELACIGLPVVIVTNQAAINRRLLSYEAAESINLRLMGYLNAQGARIEAVVWCPHRPDEACGCRKPQPGMLTYVARALGLDLARSYLVGDAANDIAAGQAVGCKTALVLTGRGMDQCAEATERWGAGCPVWADLGAAASWVVSDLAKGNV